MMGCIARTRREPGREPESSAHMVRVNTSTLEPPPAARSHRAPRPGRSLAERFPGIAAEWDTVGNFPLLASDFTYGSDSMTSWICPEGHGVYVAKIQRRTSSGGLGCPECGRIRRAAAISTSKGGATLAEAFPEIAATWDFEANYPLTPSDVAPRSNKKAFFVCPEGHGSHESFISNRTAGNGCPACGGPRRVAASRRSILLTRGSVADKHPELAAVWSDKNTLKPEEVLPGSAMLIWWNCEAGHQPFRSPVWNRTRGKGCPDCGRIKSAAAIAYTGPKPGRSLAELRPDLVPAWDSFRNTITPSDVGLSSTRMVFWVCPAGHSYDQKVRNRASSKTYPCCKAERVAARKAAFTR